MEVVEFTRKHTANVHDALNNIRRIIEALVAKRDARRDRFAKVIEKAMQTELGSDAEEVQKALSQTALPARWPRKRSHCPDARAIDGLFDGRCVRPALPGIVNAGDRVEVDQKAGRLLALAA